MSGSKSHCRTVSRKGPLRQHASADSDEQPRKRVRAVSRYVWSWFPRRLASGSVPIIFAITLK